MADTTTYALLMTSTRFAQARSIDVCDFIQYTVDNVQAFWMSTLAIFPDASTLSTISAPIDNSTLPSNLDIVPP